MQRTWRHVKLERKKIVSMKAKRKKMGYISIYFTAGRSSICMCHGCQNGPLHWERGPLDDLGYPFECIKGFIQVTRDLYWWRTYFLVHSRTQDSLGLLQPEFMREGFQKEVESKLTLEEHTASEKRYNKVCPNTVHWPLWLEVRVWRGGRRRWGGNEKWRPYKGGSQRSFWVIELILKILKVLQRVLSRGTTSSDTLYCF